MVIPTYSVDPTNQNEYPLDKRCDKKQGQATNLFPRLVWAFRLQALSARETDSALRQVDILVPKLLPETTSACQHATLRHYQNYQAKAMKTVHVHVALCEDASFLVTNILQASLSQSMAGINALPTVFHSEQEVLPFMHPNSE